MRSSVELVRNFPIDSISSTCSQHNVLVESPAKKWPGVFGSNPLFTTYPYLLPCFIAGIVPLIGAVLSLFLSYDGGPREGAIQLPGKETTIATAVPEPEASSPIDLGAPDVPPPAGGMMGNLRRKVSKRLSGYFARRVREAQAGASAPASPHIGPVPIASQNQGPSAPRRFSRSSRINGSAYGYGRARLGSMTSSIGVGGAVGLRRGSMASTLRRRYGAGVADDGEGLGTSVGTGVSGNFARRLLMGAFASRIGPLRALIFLV